MLAFSSNQTDILKANIYSNLSIFWEIGFSHTLKKDMFQNPDIDAHRVVIVHPRQSVSIPWNSHKRVHTDTHRWYLPSSEETLGILQVLLPVFS